MVWSVIATALVLFMFLVLGALVSQARGKYGVSAPATTGNPAFERVYRVHQNTAEQLIIFLPSLWMFAVYVSDPGAALLALIFIAGRIIYARSYYADASKRSAGFVIALLATLILMVGSVIGVLVPALQS
jgi:glutathione S-transferase